MYPYVESIKNPSCVYPHLYATVTEERCEIVVALRVLLVSVRILLEPAVHSPKMLRLHEYAHPIAPYPAEFAVYGVFVSFGL